MEKWPIGVFSSIDAGLGVKLEWPTSWRSRPCTSTHRTSVADAGKRREIPQAARRVRHPDHRRLRRIRRRKLRGLSDHRQDDRPGARGDTGRAARGLKEIADFAKLLGVDAVALHLGFIPDDGAIFDEVVAVTQEVCDYCRSGQNFHLETGQETAEGLLHFIAAVDRDNLFVNFDPANMILYEPGEPIERSARSAATCGASIARTPNGPPNRARNLAPRSPSEKATWPWPNSSPN